MEALSLRRPVLVSDTSGLRELAANGLCRAIPCDAGPGELAAAMVEELESHREIPDSALPDWDACAQALSDVYSDVVAGRSTVHVPPGVLPWPAATRASR
jgi:glycosyltransferase involved in cell wall biosynthesis